MYRREAANVRVRNSDSATAIEIYPDHPSYGPSFQVKAMYLSFLSDAYRGAGHSYGGIILYGCDGQSVWYTANGTDCMSGYLVIQDTDCRPTPQDKYPDEPGMVHGAIYRNAFGESCRDRAVIGEGFSMQSGGMFHTVSRSFNQRSDRYHNSSMEMNRKTQQCVESVVREWKAAGSGFSRTQSYAVKDLLAY